MVLAEEELALRPAAGEGLLVLFVISLMPVLTQGIAGKALPHQDSLQIRVPGEAHTEHVVGLPLLVVRPRPHATGRRNDGVGFVSRDLHGERRAPPRRADGVDRPLVVLPGAA